MRWRWSGGRVQRTLGAAAMAAALVLAGAGAPEAAPFDENRPKVGEKAHAFEIQGFRLSDLRGKKNLLMLFYRGHF